MSIIEEIENAKVIHQPFSFFRSDNFFSGSIYDDMVRLMPQDELFQVFWHKDAAYGKNQSTRHRFIFDKENIDKLDDERKLFWTVLTDLLKSKKVRRTIFEKLRPGLEARWGTLDIQCEPTVLIYRDVSGYKISPHTDKGTKVVTTQFYLPEDDSIEEVGTEFYTKDKSPEFKLFHKMKFLPRHGYGFAVDKKSWHGVSTISKPGVVRNSLMLIYYTENGR